MSEKLPSLFLKRGSAGPTWGRHPWIFSQALQTPSGKTLDGSEVAVYDDKKVFLGYGIFNSKSNIRVRMYSFSETNRLTEKFFGEKINAAIELRDKILRLTPESPRRLIFSESDNLSGLTVDQFGNSLAVQFTSLALWMRRDSILKQLQSALPSIKSILLRSSQAMEKLEGFVQADEWVLGNAPDQLIIQENAVRYELDLERGHKTGFYIDQRDNRALARHFAKGAEVLDLCCYTGGFALNIAAAGAKMVTGVDSSDKAIQSAKRNAELNGLTDNCEFVEADIYDFLETQDAASFDLIVLDPPRLAPNRAAKDRAIRSYFRMNEEALKRLRPGGIFISCSCSGAISPQDFASLLQSVARRLKRDMQFLDQRGPGADHPVFASCPETQYLKCFVSRVH